MSAKDRLAKEVYDHAMDLARRQPSPETYQLVKMTANLYYGTQIGLAFLNRGAEGIRARQLLDDYEASTAWLTMGGHSDGV